MAAAAPVISALAATAGTAAQLAHTDPRGVLHPSEQSGNLPIPPQMPVPQSSSSLLPVITPRAPAQISTGNKGDLMSILQMFSGGGN